AELRSPGLPGRQALVLKASPSTFSSDTETGNPLDRMFRLAIAGERTARQQQLPEPLSDSSVELLRLVLSNRGPTQTAEVVELDVGLRKLDRRATVSVANTAQAHGR